MRMMNAVDKMIDMKQKKCYESPRVRWVWLSLDEALADAGGIGVTGSKTNDGQLPDNPWGSGVKEESMGAESWPTDANLWEDEW